MSSIITSILVLGAIGALGALILFLASKKFYIYQDPRINDIQDILPAGNCGGCGFPGCSGFATACTVAQTLENLHCPVGGNTVMEKVAEIVGLAVEKTDPTTAVIRCNGSCTHRKRTNFYDGASSCAIASSLYIGETDCSYGCLGLGDCVNVCTFDAIKINSETLLPEIDENKCTSCGACINACPKLLIERRKKGPKSRRIYVSCMNKDKGAAAKKACNVACISCSKCQKACSFDAITIENNLAYIDNDKCKLCRKCVDECPTSAIVALNFPPKKEKLIEKEAVATA